MQIEVEHSSPLLRNVYQSNEDLINNLLHDIESMRVKLEQCQFNLRPEYAHFQSERPRQLSGSFAAASSNTDVSEMHQDAKSTVPLIYGNDSDSESTLPEGFCGNALIEIDEILREEEALCAFVLERARALAWQAVRHTPSSNDCARTCLNWIAQARLWAERRQLEELSATLADIETTLYTGLPSLIF